MDRSRRVRAAFNSPEFEALCDEMTLLIAEGDRLLKLKQDVFLVKQRIAVVKGKLGDIAYKAEQERRDSAGLR